MLRSLDCQMIGSQIKNPNDFLYVQHRQASEVGEVLEVRCVRALILICTSNGRDLEDPYSS